MDWQIIEQVALFLVMLLAGGAEVVLIRRLKGLLNLTEEWTLFAVTVLAVILAICIGVVEGVLTPESFVLDNLALTVLAIITASQVRYRQLRDKLKGE